MQTSRCGSTKRIQTPAPQTAWSPSPADAFWLLAPMADSNAVPKALLLLANLGRPRRPAGAAIAHAEPILPDAITAAAQLRGLADQPIASSNVSDLRRLQRAAVKMAEAILAGRVPDPRELNALVAGSTARVEVVVTKRVVR